MAVGLVKTIRRMMSAPRVGHVGLGALAQAVVIGAPEDAGAIYQQARDAFLSDHIGALHGRILIAGAAPDWLTKALPGAQLQANEGLDAASLPPTAFDAMLLLDTLAFSEDPGDALLHLVTALAPGGTMIATFPGTAYDSPALPDTLLWRFSAQAVERMCADLPAGVQAQVIGKGNILAAVGSTLSLPPSILTGAKAPAWDPSYPVMIGLKVQR